MKITPVNDLTWRSDYDAVYSIAAKPKMCFKEEVVQSVSISTGLGSEWHLFSKSTLLLFLCFFGGVFPLRFNQRTLGSPFFPHMAAEGLLFLNMFL